MRESGDHGEGRGGNGCGGGNEVAMVEEQRPMLKHFRVRV